MIIPYHDLWMTLAFCVPGACLLPGLLSLALQQTNIYIVGKVRLANDEPANILIHLATYRIKCIEILR